jgi:hypothetical protein
LQSHEQSQCVAARHPRAEKENVEPLAEADELQRCVGLASPVADIRHQRDVLASCEAGDQVVELEHEADVLAPVSGQFRLIGVGELMVGEADFSRRRGVETAENVEQRRFAAPRGTQQDNEFACANLESTPRNAWTSTSPIL